MGWVAGSTLVDEQTGRFGFEQYDNSNDAVISLAISNYDCHEERQQSGQTARSR